MRVRPCGNHPPLGGCPLTYYPGAPPGNRPDLARSSTPACIAYTLHRGPSRPCPRLMEKHQTVRPMVSTIAGVCHDAGGRPWFSYPCHQTQGQVDFYLHLAYPNNLSSIPCRSLGRGPEEPPPPPSTLEALRPGPRPWHQFHPCESGSCHLAARQPLTAPRDKQQDPGRQAGGTSTQPQSRASTSNTHI
jgi:hypothetical protein